MRDFDFISVLFYIFGAVTGVIIICFLKTL